MKAIYINIDPYLQAVADWLNAGKPGTAPSFDPLPVAVTIPLGEPACIYCLAVSAEDPTGPVQSWDDFDNQTISVYGNSLSVGMYLDDGDILDGLAVPGFSAVAPSAKYLVASVSGDISVPVRIGYGETDDDAVTFAVPVLVRRETASGPVDLVDFTPPAAAPSAADIKSALVAAGNTALAGVCLNGTKWLQDGETDLSSVFPTAAPGDDNPALALTSPGS